MPRPSHAPLAPFPDATLLWRPTTGRAALHVESVWADEGGAAHAAMPDGRVDVVLAADGGSAVVIGSLTRARPLPLDGPTVGVQLRPDGVTGLLPARAEELTDRVVPLDELVGGTAALRDAIASAPGAMARAAILRAWVESRLERAGDAAAPAAVRHAARRWLEAPGARIEAVANETGVTRQHLRRLFLQHVGLAPKRFARVQRLGRVMRRVPPRGRVSWSRLALDAGYADQAHLIADFRELVGTSPEAWRRRGATWFGDCTLSRRTGAPIR